MDVSHGMPGSFAQASYKHRVLMQDESVTWWLSLQYDLTLIERLPRDTTRPWSAKPPTRNSCVTAVSTTHRTQVKNAHTHATSENHEPTNDMRMNLCPVRKESPASDHMQASHKSKLYRVRHW